MIKFQRIISGTLILVLLLWIGLFIWRKTFSYINIGGVYIIEAIIFLALGISFTSILLKKRPTFYVPANRNVQTSIILAFFFIGYNIIRAILSSSINAKGLIPGVYPLMYVISILLSQNSDTKIRLGVNKTMTFFYFSCFLVYFLNASLVEPVFGVIEAPGWTYIYGVSMAASVVLIRNWIGSLFLFGTTFILSMISFERASFANFALAVLFVFFSFNRADKITFIKTSLTKMLVLMSVVILLTPILIDLFFDLELLRFDITPGNILKFFYSIFSSEIDLSGGFGGLSGTRDHRLEMWRDIVSKIFESPDTALFGFGYHGEVLDILQVSFRAPHNGFVTILYRGGLIGLFLYLFFLVSLLYTLFNFVRSSISRKEKQVAFLGLILAGSFIGDALTGTIIDSPFTSFLFYVQIGIIVVILNIFRN